MQAKYPFPPLTIEILPQKDRESREIEELRAENARLRACLGLPEGGPR
jgi:cell shape-determining protein MreC